MREIVHIPLYLDGLSKLQKIILLKKYLIKGWFNKRDLTKNKNNIKKLFKGRELLLADKLIEIRKIRNDEVFKVFVIYFVKSIY